MNLDDFGDFPRSPPDFGYNSTGQENPVLCIFFRFRDLYGLKLTGDFSRINIFQNMTIRDFGTKQKEPGGGISTRWRAHPPGRATMVIGPPGPPQAHFKTLSRFS